MLGKKKKKRLMLGKSKGNSRLLDSITDSMDMNLSKLQELVMVMKA